MGTQKDDHLLDEFEGDREPAAAPEGFEKAAYMRAFPDVQQAIAEGKFQSALQHYLEFGATEDRLLNPLYLHALASVYYEEAEKDAAGFPAASVEAAFITASGHLLIIGWINDDQSALDRIDIAADGALLASIGHIARCRRQDAETAVGSAPGHLLGFWTVAETTRKIAASQSCGIKLHAGQNSKIFQAQLKLVTDEKLRHIIFEYFAAAQYFTNHQITSCHQIDSEVGSLLVDWNVKISNQITSKASCLRFGPDKKSYTGSVIVCLYGKAEFLFLQSAFFSVGANWQDYEFVYVTNSPELTEVLQREATIVSRLYDISLSLVFLPDNAGFGAANNAAVNYARSNRILIVNPDVFPRHDDWADAHKALVENLPAEQVKLFGAPLYYDDGSLMHAGMFFEIDLSLSMTSEGIQHSDFIRVEHFGKGAPPDTAAFLQSRPVPAVTGAFMSADRNWFEKLGGFSPEYVFGHYEDADLCLKSLSAGTPVWIHNLPFWHLEGKGSTRRPVHEGGSFVNRWHFTKTWGDWISAEMHGRSPKRLAAR